MAAVQPADFDQRGADAPIEHDKDVLAGALGV